jgi:NAD(P)-dependent dehydrogenase (short-subunit alcohol dehydrogenase family)
MRKPKTFPRQKQKHQPGSEKAMTPRPESKAREYRAAGKLKGKVALITGGDSGIGRAVAIAFAREGADVAIVYLKEHEDARETEKLIKKEGRRCLRLAGDVTDDKFCRKAVKDTVAKLGALNVLVNNAAVQFPQDDLSKITNRQLERTFQTNIFSMFYLTRAALPHLKEDDAIVNSTSVTAYRGSEHLIDYSSTKGAIVAFTRSLAKNLVDKKIRVNAVAPGPIWTPLIPSTFPADKTESFGSQVPMKRAGQPDECAPCYVFLACDDSSYMTGQVLHPNGGEVVNG